MFRVLLLYSIRWFWYRCVNLFFINWILLVSRRVTFSHIRFCLEFTWFEFMPMTYISITKGYISRYTQRPNNVGLLLVFIVKNILFLRNKSLKFREKININLTTASLKLKSSNVCALIDSIFAMGGKLLFSTDSDIYFFFIGNLLSPSYCYRSRRSYWYQLISSSLCSFIYIKHTPWSVSHRLYRHHIVLLSTMIRYNVAPALCRHTNAPTFQCFKTIDVK